MPIHGKLQNREGRQHRSPEDDADRVAGLFLAGRDAGELAHDELKVALCLGLLLTCMGLFLSSDCFWVFLTVLCSER